MFGKLLVFLGKFKLIYKLFSSIGKFIGWLTPQGVHMIYRFFKLKGKAKIEIDDVSISDESEDGFKATVHMSVRSTNKEALTTIKTEIINKPLINI